MAGCAHKYVTAPIDPALTEEIVDPPLRGRTWQDVFNQSMERAEALRRWNCRGYVLRREALPGACE